MVFINHKDQTSPATISDSGKPHYDTIIHPNYFSNYTFKVYTYNTEMHKFLIIKNIIKKK